MDFGGELDANTDSASADATDHRIAGTENLQFLALAQAYFTKARSLNMGSNVPHLRTTADRQCGQQYRRGIRTDHLSRSSNDLIENQSLYDPILHRRRDQCKRLR